MPSWETLVIFTAAAVVMNLSPGPSNFYILSRSISQGARAGTLATLGLAAGGLVYVAAAAFGLSLLFQAAPPAYTALKLLGAGYLIYLGVRTILAKPEPIETRAVDRRSLARIFRESVLVELLNPKTALFFLAFLPQFADPSVGPVAPQVLVLGLIVTLTAIPCDLAVAFGGAAAAGWIGRNAWAGRLQNRVSGTILVGLGGYVGLAEIGE